MTGRLVPAATAELASCKPMKTPSKVTGLVPNALESRMRASPPQISGADNEPEALILRRQFRRREHPAQVGLKDRIPNRIGALGGGRPGGDPFIRVLLLSHGGERRQSGDKCKAGKGYSTHVQYPESVIRTAGITPHPVPLPMGEGRSSNGELPRRADAAPIPSPYGERDRVRGKPHGYGSSFSNARAKRPLKPIATGSPSPSAPR